MMPAWLRSLCRRIVLTAPRGGSANVNPNPAPEGPPPISQTRPRATTAPAEPDLTFVGTREMFAAIAVRYDACAIVCVRRGERDDGSYSVVYLTHGVEQPAGFLHSAARAIADESQIREIKEGDL